VCYEATRVVVLRCKDFSFAYTNRFIDKCKSFDGVPYDNMFELGVEALSCSELVYEADYERRMKVNLEDVVGLGQLYISPTGLWKSTNVDIIIDTNKL
jgi:hypothetical protein